MKLAPARIEQFVQHPPASLRVALVFGPDSGAVKLRGDALAKSACADLDDPFRVTVLQSADIAADPAILFDAMAAQALGGGRCLIRVPQAEEKIALAVTKLLADLPDGDNLLVLEAGELDKKSKLRALAEGDAPEIAAVVCYPETGADRTRLISGWLNEHKIKIAPDALPLLSDLTPPDRLGLFSELEKLALYVGVDGTISESDILAALGDAGAVDMDSMVMAVGDGDKAGCIAGLRRLQAEAVAPVALLRAAQRHFLRLLETRNHIDTGLGVKDAMNKLQPRIFWKHETQFARQVQRWPAAKILRALAALVEAEAQSKSTGLPDVTLTQQLLLTLARAA
jgi:DNA polymerase-3 subunit delta